MVGDSGAEKPCSMGTFRLFLIRTTYHDYDSPRSANLAQKCSITILHFERERQRRRLRPPPLAAARPKSHKVTPPHASA
jgi:hypothetical protein